MTTVTELNFDDLTPIEIPVSIKGEKYVLKEPTEGAVCRWRDAQLKASKLTDGKLTSMDGLADTEPLLVSLCIFKIRDLPDGSKKEVPVELPVVRGWSGRIVKVLFEKLKEIGELEEKDTEEVLQKRLKDTQEQLKALRNGKSVEGPEGNVLAAMADICA